MDEKVTYSTVDDQNEPRVVSFRQSTCPSSIESSASRAAMCDKGLDPDNDPVSRTDFVRRVTLQPNDMDGP
jgi:hypothetical protein